jgi:type IV pilus assembly protein PilE
MKMAGVTLIELLIAVAIVGILAAIAYPSYQRYVARTHRNAAAACLSQLGQFMERAYTGNFSYLGVDQNLPCETENSLNRRYAISVQASTRTTYTLQAVPTTLQSAADTCGTLTINQRGQRTPTTAGCW